MTISSLNDYMAANKQLVNITKTASITSVAAMPFTVFNQVGTPGAGTFAGTDTAAGVVPTDATAGCPTINSFGGGNTGYITSVIFSNTVASRIRLYDCLFKAGAYNYNASVSLANQPSFSSRVPDANYAGLELWIEAVTAFTGNLSIAITYTDQAGGTGHTTGTVATGLAPTAGRMIQLPFAAGDCGIQKVESVTATVSAAGTFNVLVLRPLWEGRVRSANDGDNHDFLKTGLVRIYDNSALMIQVAADSTATGIPSVLVEVSDK